MLKENDKKQKGLEEAITERVSSLLEETMEKNWGITIPKIEGDITDKLKKPYFDFYIPFNQDFQKAKKKFKAEFLKKELQLHLGNISQLAKSLGLDRRSIHRVIKDFRIDVDKLKPKENMREEFQKDLVGQTIRSTLDQYKELIQPQQMEKMYEEVSSLSRNIAKFLPHQDLSWKEAEREFEKQFLQNALQENKRNITQTAEKIKIRVETLHRKIKKLGLKKE